MATAARPAADRVPDRERYHVLQDVAEAGGQRASRQRLQHGPRRGGELGQREDHAEQQSI